MPSSSVTVRCVVDGPSRSAGGWAAGPQSPRGYGRVDRGIGDQRAPSARELVRQQALDRHADEVRVAEVAAAVGERVARGLEVAVQRLRAVGAQGRVALEDVQRLADGRAAAGRRAHAPDVQALVVDLGRRALGRAVAGDVGLGDQAASPVVVGSRRGRRALRGVGDRLGDRAAVEALRAVARDPLVRARHVRVAQGRADVLRRAVGIEVDRRGRRDVVEEVDVRRGLVEERLVDLKAAAGDVDARFQRLAQRLGAVALERVLPRRHRARHARGQPAPARVGERQRRTVLEERVRTHRRSRGLAPVDRRHLAVTRADDHEPAAADAGRERLGDAEHARRGDGGVDGVAALAQHVDRGVGGEDVDRGGRALRADRGRLLDRRLTGSTAAVAGTVSPAAVTATRAVAAPAVTAAGP